MANNNNNNGEQAENKNSKKMVFITSIDDDNHNILSCLNSKNVEAIVVNLSNTKLMNGYQINNEIPKRSLSQLEQQIPSIDVSKNTNTKKRKADLTCVICEGQAIGYNFDQISCESCKAFFRRNAFHPIEKTKCINYNDNVFEVRCNIRYDIKYKCQRCRLLKCFREGMRKDFILTPEEKQLKKQRLEENRRLSSAVINNNIKSENIIEPITINQNNALLDNTRSHSSTFLTEADRSCLSHIQNAYFSASQSTPSASSVISLELASDKMSTFMNTIDIQNFIAIKLINFLREIPEFAQLDDDDRLILVKYNLTLLFVIRYSLNFDSAREIFYDVDTGEPVSPSEEAFAQYCKSLFILCYGYEFNRIAMSIFHALTSIVNKDPIITQLLMLIMIFSKGLSANDDQEPLLNDEKRVFYAQSKYTDLLFRYLMEQSSFEVVIIKMTHIIQQLLKIQKISRDFRQYIKSNVDLTHVNPLMKSLLHLT
ncbi:unnamed protein product [Rotaria sp. Silwood1]|nr:unnamed protein product [Rotaria sp. Silwood1]CAF3417472.1 unnamed protein product [Rotaria sp. Silwood1]CAF4533398.1 unnamed protein product [Rotaria sp. Silwood1]